MPHMKYLLTPGKSFYILVILTFLCYANGESDELKNNSRNIEAVYFELGTRNVNHKRSKMTLFILLLLVL